MRVYVKETLYHDRLGRLSPGRIVDVPDKTARRWISGKAAEEYETKVLHDRPSPAGGMTEPSSASPPAQVSPQTTSNASEPGAPKRSRRRSAESL